MRGLVARLCDGVEVAEFFDDQLRLGWLGVRDVEGARFAGLQLCQGVGCRVQAALGNGARAAQLANFQATALLWVAMISTARSAFPANRGVGLESQPHSRGIMPVRTASRCLRV